MSTNSWLAQANQQLEQIKQLTNRVELRFVELPPHSMGVGFGVAFSETDFVVISVLAQNENHAYVSAGVLQNVDQTNKLRVLELCNELISQNSEVPLFLHDAEVGWDIVAQLTVPIPLLFEVPPYYAAVLRNVKQTAQAARAKFAESGLVGQPYHWDNIDAERLLSRSLI